ncbi:MAG TPA: SIMPL domain-containing protein, partial [Hymenobacter sp.]
AKALANAQQRAETLARQANTQVGAPLHIEEVVPGLTLHTEEATDKYRYAYHDMQVRGTDSESLNLRKIRVNSVVEVEYELK